MLKIKVFTFSPIQENTYVLYNEKNDCLIIDPGCYFPEEQQELKAFIDKNGLIPQKLLNTHCHLDHVFGNKFVAETWDLTLHLHPKEEIVLQFAPTSGLMYDMPFDNYQGKFIFLNDGDTITLGEDELEIILAPGHSPGSICFYCKAQKFIIGGDVLFNGSIGRTDLPMGDPQTLLSSIKQKLFVLPDDVIIHSGHGPETTIGNEKKFNPFVGEGV
ncbi:MAG TPA: MBL fold metallo-hydrolase [Chitinophagaceae bacterium]|nr:MBL fold metallo-hydrolase [Chitinophagaceae bacterium]